MVLTDIVGKVGVVCKYVLCSSLLILNLGNQLAASEAAPPPPLVCDDQINVSLGQDCEAVITADLILEGTFTGTFTVLISGVSGSTITAPGNYVVTVTDGTNSCWGNILVENKLAPECSDQTVQLPFLCGDIEGLLPPTITSPSCVTIADIRFSDQFTDGGCAASTLVRTWIIEGDNGAIGNCTSTYTTSPFDAAAIRCPLQEPETFGCDADLSPDGIYERFFKECFLTLAPSIQSDPESFPAEVQICIDAGNNAAYPHYYDGTSTISLNGAVCNTFAEYRDILLPVCDAGPGCDGANKILREWSIYEWCDSDGDGNPLVKRCNQVLAVTDNVAPDLEVSDFTSSVDPWGCTADIVFPKPTHLFDDCSSFVDYTITTTTTVVTPAGDDTGAGTGTTGGTGSGTGSGSGGGSTTTVISDPGLAGVAITFDPDLGFIAAGVPRGTYTFYYNAFDCCGNTTVEAVQVTVVDATPPVAITKQDIVVSLIPNPGSVGEPGITKIFAENIDNGSFDGCGDVQLEIRREVDGCGFDSNLTFNNDGHMQDDSLDMDGGKFVNFCCNDLVEFGIDEDGDGAVDYARFRVYLRVWDDGDGDGTFGSAGDNFSEVWSFVRLEDKSNPTIVCPGPIEIECDGDISDMSQLGRATAFNSCGELATGHRDINVELSNCFSGTVTREWFIVGNESINCMQTITKLGSTPADIELTFPDDRILSCSEELPDDVPTWVAGPCDQIAYNVDRDTFFFQEGACFKILNYWTVINWCTYEPDNPTSDGIYSDVQVIKIFDESAPVIACPTGTQVLTTMTGECSGPVMLTSSATDEGLCASNSLRWEAQVDLQSDWNIDFVFSSSMSPSSGFYIPPSLSGEEVKINVPEGDSGEHRVLWRVSDGCGNNTTCTTFFTVADNVPPTPYCVNLSTALMETGSVDIWACDFDLGAFDNCSAQEDLRFTFTDVPPADDPDYNPLAQCSARTFDCDDVINPAGTIVPVNVYVWDTDGNSDFCTVFLTLVDNNGNCPDGSGSISISGEISTETGQMVEDVEVSLVSNQPNYPISSMTDDSGIYMFVTNPVDRDYTVSGTKNSDYLNGVSTLDLVMIQRHILGIEPITSPYKLVAADVNDDQNINGLDLVELRKLILGIYSELPQNDSWRFINTGTSMDIQFPWPLDEIREIFAVQNNMMTEDFVGVKVGDVNDDAVANAMQAPAVGNRSNSELTLDFADQVYAEGDFVEMTLSSEQASALAGMQFALQFDGLELVDLAGKDLEIADNNFALIADDVMSFSWNSLSNVNAQDLMTIKYRATKSGRLSESITLASTTNAEAYIGGALTTIPVTLSGQDNSEHEFVLYQNNPNPFRGMTTISFNLPSESPVTITVTDVTGKLVYAEEGVFQKGMNSLDFNTQGWNASGLLYYTIETDNHSATNKMIVLK
jgi:hypothetical protein